MTILKGKACFKGLGKNIREELKQIAPEEISCEIDRKENTVMFIFVKDSIAYRGIAICSVLDKFDEYEGKNKAAGRAIKAYKRKESSERIRKDFLEFPNGWTKKQIENVISNPFPFKSSVLNII